MTASKRDQSMALKGTKGAKGENGERDFQREGNGRAEARREGTKEKNSRGGAETRRKKTPIVPRLRHRFALAVRCLWPCFGKRNHNFRANIVHVITFFD